MTLYMPYKFKLNVDLVYVSECVMQDHLVCAPCRWDDITIQNRLSLARRMHRMVPVGRFSMGTSLAGVDGPIVELRRSYHRLISTMGFPTLVRLCLYIESGPWLYVQLYDSPPIDCELYMPMTNSRHDIFYVSVPVFALTWMNKKKRDNGMGK